MAWVYLLLAGLFEVVWATTLKQSAGFTRLAPSFVTLAAMIVSFAFLAMALKTIPLGSAYAIWTGIGALGALAVGILLFDEPATLLRIASAALILAGIVGLKLSAA